MYKFLKIVNSSSSNIVIISSTVSAEFVCIGFKIYNQVLESKQRYHIILEKPVGVNHLFARHPNFLIVIVLNQSVFLIGSKNFPSERQVIYILRFGLHPYPFALVKLDAVSKSTNIFIGISKFFLYLIERVTR